MKTNWQLPKYDDRNCNQKQYPRRWKIRKSMLTGKWVVCLLSPSGYVLVDSFSDLSSAFDWIMGS